MLPPYLQCDHRSCSFGIISFDTNCTFVIRAVDKIRLAWLHPQSSLGGNFEREQSITLGKISLCVCSIVYNGSIDQNISYCQVSISTTASTIKTRKCKIRVQQMWASEQLVTQRDYLCSSYLGFCDDHLYFSIQATEKYSTAMYYFSGGLAVLIFSARSKPKVGSTHFSRTCSTIENPLLL